jgi:hypothetical protein
MKTITNSSIAADEISIVRLTPGPRINSTAAYTIPPPPTYPQNTTLSNIILLNIDWSRVPPYKKKVKA